LDPNFFYKDYYNKPDWWFKFRYDTQYKVKSALYALEKIKFNCKNKNIFEFGFGSGELLLSFQDSNGISGVEISAIAVEKIINKAANKEIREYMFKLADNKNIYSYSKSAFDLVIASHVIEHLEDTEEFITQIRYLLNDEGIVLIQIPINENFKDPKHVHSFTSISLSQKFQKSGFKTLFIEENEYLYHIVEELYFSNEGKRWSLFDNIKRIIFNITLSWMPYNFIEKLENIYKYINSKKPRQAVLIFQKRELL